MWNDIILLIGFMRVLIIGVSIVFSNLAQASIVLTEINLTTGQIEITNTGNTSFSGTLLVLRSI